MLEGITSLLRTTAIACVASLPASSQESPRSASAATPAAAPDFVAIARNVLPCVVTVRTFVRDPAAAAKAAAQGPSAATVPQQAGWVAAPTTERDYPGFKPHGAASGFFAEGGDVLTCLPPLLVAPEKQVDLIEIETMDGHRVLCDVIGVEPTLDLAVLRCAVFPSWAKPQMKSLPFGDSEALELGASVIGAGDPPGPERYLAAGLLVAKPSRDCYQELMNATYMQATMYVHPGACGGALVDVGGNVVGILTKLEFEGNSATGSAWALPSKILSGLYESIRAAGTTQSPWLGFSVMSRSEIATTRGLPALQAMRKPPHGILLENVFQPSPATAAGLQPGDFLTHFDGVEIHAPVDFQRQLYLAGVGRKVALRFFRAGEMFTKDLVIEKRPNDARPR